MIDQTRFGYTVAILSWCLIIGGAVGKMRIFIMLGLVGEIIAVGLIETAESQEK